MVYRRRLSRRRFLKRGAQAASVLAAPYIVSKSALGNPGSVGANDQIGLAFIGFGGRGRQLWRSLPKSLVRVVAVSDVNLPRAEAAAGEMKSRPNAFQDYRKMLERKDVDAVIVATPD